MAQFWKNGKELAERMGVPLVNEYRYLGCIVDEFGTPEKAIKAV